MRSAEEWMLEIFNPSPTDCQTWRQDLQLAITLNPDIELIEKAINEARREAIMEAAEVAKTIKTGNSGSWYDASVDKQSILQLLNQVQ